MISINNKYEVGETVFLVRHEKCKDKCKVCEGAMKITYKDKKYRCPECWGNGFTYNSKYEYSTSNKEYLIRSISVRIVDEEKPIIKYNLSQFGQITEDKVFATMEEAQRKCDELNKEQENKEQEQTVIELSCLETYRDIIKVL